MIKKFFRKSSLTVLSAGLCAFFPWATLAGGTTSLSTPGSATPVKKAVAWQFPATRSDDPPSEVWLPAEPSDADRARRVATDRFVARSSRLNSKWLANAGRLQQQLRDGQYDLIEAELDAIQAKDEADPAYELVAQSAANFANIASVDGLPPDKSLIDAWLKGRPKSPWAHYSAGLRWSSTAWRDRGDGWANGISAARWKKVHQDEIHARNELREVLRFNPKISIAWVTLMNVDRTDPGAGLNKVTADYAAGSKANPASFLIPDQYETALEPRWMGSVEVMDEFAQSEVSKAAKNPRFWSLQGEALADGGCTACNGGHWDESLKMYNAALAYEDEPSWLMMAGDAARHLGRYALAYRYYERANSYDTDELQWAMLRDFMVELCDPSQSAAEIDRYRRDMVKYAGIDDEPYPHNQDACVVYQRELPWGKEPVSTAGAQPPYHIEALPPYYIEDNLDPVRVTGTESASFPGKTEELASPDGRRRIVEVDAKTSDTAGATRRLELRDTATGAATPLLSYRGSVDVAWAEDGHRFMVNLNPPTAHGMSCQVFDTEHPAAPVDLSNEVMRQIADQDPSLKGRQIDTRCGGWWNNHDLDFAVYATAPGKVAIVQKQYYFNAVTGRVGASSIGNLQ